MKKWYLGLAALFLLLSCEGEKPSIVHVTAVSLNRGNADVGVGETLTLVSTVSPADATNKSVVWSSNREAVATVDNNGVVTGVSDGVATITVKSVDGNKTADCIITVQGVPASVATLAAGNISAVSAVLKGELLPGTSTEASELGFQYSTSSVFNPDPSATTYVSVSNRNGDTFSAQISGLNPGTKYYYRAVVKQNGQDSYGNARSFDTKALSTLIETLAATEVGITGATLSARLDPTDVPNIGSAQYGFFYGTSASSLDTKITCTGWNANAFSTSLTNLSSGTHYWYKAFVTIGGKTFYGSVLSFTTVIFVITITDITLSDSSLSLVEGNTKTLSATVSPSNATNKSLKWTSSNTAVATVDNNGKITAKAKGKTTIQVSAQDGSGTAKTCEVVVSHPCPQGALDLGMTTEDGYKLYWATCNLASDGFVSHPRYPGAFFAWGETAPKTTYTWGNYKWWNKSQAKLTKYNYDSYYGTVDNKYTLETGSSGDDAASKILGSHWRMPTRWEWVQLAKHCTREWVYVYSAHYVKYMDNDSGNAIFLPTAGRIDNDDIQEEDEKGCYWTSSLSPSSDGTAPYDAIYLRCGENTGGISWTLRYIGMSIRPVYD
ncbi:MAG: Ig-like domain-containing protein [Bacteroidales bacterium]|nr:Ig-like domain-containing protein [Bacteroidales bacterium]